MCAAGKPSTFGKDKLYPNTQVSHCYFNHFALNYASVCAPASMPRAIWAPCGVLSLHPASRALPQISGCVKSVSYSWTHMAEVGEPHTTFSKQIYLPHFFLYSPTFTSMLCITAFLPSHDSSPKSHPSQYSTAKENRKTGRLSVSQIDLGTKTYSASYSAYLW